MITFKIDAKILDNSLVSWYNNSINHEVRVRL